MELFRMQYQRRAIMTLISRFTTEGAEPPQASQTRARRRPRGRKGKPGIIIADRLGMNADWEEATTDRHW